MTRSTLLASLALLTTLPVATPPATARSAGTELPSPSVPTSRGTSADLDLSWTPAAVVAIPGNPATLDLDLENLSGNVASNPVVIVNVPPKLRLESTSGCEGTILEDGFETVQWESDHLSPGEVNSCLLSFEVQNWTGSPLAFLPLSASHDGPDPEPSNSSGLLAEIELDDYIDLRLSLVADPDIVEPDGSLEVILSLLNYGSRDTVYPETEVEIIFSSDLLYAGTGTCSGAIWDSVTQTLNVPMGTIAARIGAKSCAFPLNVDAAATPGLHPIDAAATGSFWQAWGIQATDRENVTITSEILYTDTLADGSDADPGDGVCATSEGDCTLRAAIQEANATSGYSTIVAVGFGSYQLTGNVDSDASGDLDIRSDLTLRGIGFSGLVPVLAAPGQRVFEIHGDVDVTLRDLSIRNGAPSGNGGGVLQSSAGSVLHLDGVELRDNYAWQGGALETSGETYFVDVWMHRNDAGSEGGAVHGDFGSVVDLRSSTLENNSATSGGAITLRGDLRTLNTTISGNDATAAGGALFLTNDATAVLNHSTVTANTAGYAGGDGAGGAFSLQAGAVVRLRGSIVSGNEAWESGSTVPSLCSGTITEATASVLHPGADADCLFGPEAQGAVVAEAILGPLTDNGGSTKTHALDRESPGIDLASSCSWDDDGDGLDPRTVETDQRGAKRPNDSDGDLVHSCDAGAFEVPEIPLFADGFENGTTSLWDEAR